jgi:hypothetical protein
MLLSACIAVALVFTAIGWYSGDTHRDPYTGETVRDRDIDWKFVALVVIGGLVAAALWRIVRVYSERGESSATAELERLANLHARGALDDAEFQAAKRRILG